VVKVLYFAHTNNIMHTHKWKSIQLATLLLAEGNVFLTAKGGTIKFTNTSKELQKLFKKLVRELGYQAHQKDSKNVVVYSTKLAKNLIELCKDFRVKPYKTKGKIVHTKTQFPREVFGLPERKITEILRIFFTCEGGVVIGKDKRNDEVIVRVCHPILQQQVLKLLKKLGINARTRGRGLIYIKKRDEIIKFSKKIGFIPRVKAVRGKNKGVEKNHLLNILLSRHRPVQTARQANRAELHRGLRRASRVGVL